MISGCDWLVFCTWWTVDRHTFTQLYTGDLHRRACKQLGRVGLAFCHSRCEDVTMICQSNVSMMRFGESRFSSESRLWMKEQKTEFMSPSHSHPPLSLRYASIHSPPFNRHTHTQPPNTCTHTDTHLQALHWVYCTVALLRPAPFSVSPRPILADLHGVQTVFSHNHSNTHTGE